MASSVSGKMNPILCCDWVPERARWSYLARSGLPAASCKKNFPKSLIMNPLLTKLVQSRWLDIGLVLFSEFMDLDSVSVHKLAKKKNWPISSHLASHLVNNPYLLYGKANPNVLIGSFLVGISAYGPFPWKRS